MGRWLLALLITVVALLGFTVPVLWAHAELRESYPEVGAVFRWDRPSEVRLRFTQKLEEASIVVTNRQFEAFQVGSAQVDPDNPREMFIPLRDLSPATYTVNWRTMSVDGHALEGAYDFTVLPREPLVTMIIAAIILPLFGILVYTRRARPEDWKADSM
ncbi:MAG: copper resistance protein CopC [Chloroflexota bacterium]|nr:copper resistance protein CopC [Chloroflexota bacterium]